MSFLPMLIQLVCGAIGGNVAGALMKKFDLGTALNSIVGILGGGIGGQLLAMLGFSGGGTGTFDLSNIVGSIAAGGVGGGVLLAIVGAIKAAMGKK